MENSKQELAALILAEVDKRIEDAIQIERNRLRLHDLVERRYRHTKMDKLLSLSGEEREIESQRINKDNKERETKMDAEIERLRKIVPIEDQP